MSGGGGSLPFAMIISITVTDFRFHGPWTRPIHLLDVRRDHDMFYSVSNAAPDGTIFNVFLAYAILYSARISWYRLNQSLTPCSL